MRVPKYRKWSSRDQGFADYKGKRTYFSGPYGSPESLAAYEAWAAKVRVEMLAERSPDSLNLAELAWLYLNHCKSYYGDGPRSTTASIRVALREVAHFGLGSGSVSLLSPKTLKALQQAMVEKGLARRTINDRASMIKRWVKWLVSEELAPPGVYQALLTVPNLAKGRSEAREVAPREPVAWEHVERSLPFMSDTIKSMVLFQWHTGCRAGSVVKATPGQFDRDPQEPRLLLWSPRHKTEHLGKGLTIPIGPKCQAALSGRLEGDADAPLFPTQAGRHYTTQSYGRAIRRAQERHRVACAAQGTPEPSWWSSHQLRHSKGHMVRELYGVEAAQAVLGHDSIEATQIYSQARLHEARRVALELG